MKRLLALAALAPLLASCAGAPPAPPPAPAAAPIAPRTDVLVARARALRAEGDVEGARSRLETALRNAPLDDDARLELADLLVSQGEELARAEELLLTVPSSVRLHLLRARLAEARRDDALAAAEYGAVLAAQDDPDARLRRALALERLGRGEEALAELERVRVARPDDAIVRAQLAEGYEAARRLGEAETEYRFLAEQQPGRATGWERLARFYERTGRERDARAAHEKAKAAGQRPERTLRPLPRSRN
ncbi:MAG TPA: tetratricopeptide repeat protein [Anaeromyxobacter sp.]